MGTQAGGRQTADPSATQLIALSRNAQVNVDLDDPADYWYRLGQRNAYAYAAGLALTRGATEAAFEVSERITTALSDGLTDVAAIERSATDGTGTVAAAELEWIGPLAFASRYQDVPGVDRDFGMRWGERGDVRISLRRPPDVGSGMLYAYDPTWDEYAVLGHDVPSAAVESAFTQALQVDVHMDPASFNELVRSNLSLTPALPTRSAHAGRVIET